MANKQSKSKEVKNATTSPIDAGMRFADRVIEKAGSLFEKKK